MGGRPALLVSGLVFVAGFALLGATLLLSRVTAVSLGFAVALLVPAGVVALLVGTLGLVFSMVAYTVDRRRQSEGERVEKEDGA